MKLYSVSYANRCPDSVYFAQEREKEMEQLGSNLKYDEEFYLENKKKLQAIREARLKKENETH